MATSSPSDSKTNQPAAALQPRRLHGALGETDWVLQFLDWLALPTDGILTIASCPVSCQIKLVTCSRRRASPKTTQNLNLKT